MASVASSSIVNGKRLKNVLPPYNDNSVRSYRFKKGRICEKKTYLKTKQQMSKLG